MFRTLVGHRRTWVVLLVSALLAGACAKLNTSGNLAVGAAAAHVFIDDPDASIVDRSALPQDLRTLQARAELYGRMMTTRPVLADIAKRVGVPANQVSGIAQVTGNVPIQFSQAGSEEHAAQLEESLAPYRLELQADPYEPILNIYAEGPSVPGAVQLANASIAGLEDYLRSLAAQQGFPVRELPQLRQLGTARGGLTNRSAKIEIAALTFITAFALIFAVLWFALPGRGSGPREDKPRRRRPRLSGRALADWPRTTRALPWSIAGLIAMFWLTPFDRIQVAAGGSPVNITLDRLVLPIVFMIWLVAFRAGPGAAPRLRLTRVHVAVAAYLLCAFLSVVLDAQYLNHTGELAIAVKKLPLLVSYMSVFVIVASSVRRSEVAAFMSFTLVLAVIVGVGVIYEYRSGTNIFTSLSSVFLHGPFKQLSTDPTNASTIDSLGRRTVEGPAAYGVELVTMLSIALPIALLGMVKSRTRGRYLMYGAAVAILLYAMFTTDRKTALVAPAVVLVTVAYLRRRQLLSMAPLALIAVVVIIAVAPASVRNVLSQYTAPNASHVATVDSRTANYDAIRPDLWTHLLFGRGQGSYAPPTDRIVDSDIILPLVETGILGLIAFVMVPFSVIIESRRAASGRDPISAPAAVCGVSAGVCFIAVATLYSAMSLPHGPDVFLYFAGLAVVAVRPPDGEPETPRHDHQELARRSRRRSRRAVHTMIELAPAGLPPSKVRTRRKR